MRVVMRVLILWWNWSGYMDACARQLQELLSCKLDIVCLAGPHGTAPFQESEFYTYPCSNYVSNHETLIYVKDQIYDLILICGWHVAEYRKIARLNRGRSIRVLCMDNQWNGS